MKPLRYQIHQDILAILEYHQGYYFDRKILEKKLSILLPGFTIAIWKSELSVFCIHIWKKDVIEYSEACYISVKSNERQWKNDLIQKLKRIMK